MLNRAGKACGFSLIELLLVLAALLAVSAALVLPGVRGTMTAYRLKASGDLVLGELDAARVMAISRGTDYRVTFDTNANTVSVVDPQDLGNAPRLPKTLEPGVNITSASTITFRSRGTCTGGTIRLADDQNVASINVTATGKMTMYIAGSSSN